MNVLTEELQRRFSENGYHVFLVDGKQIHNKTSFLKAVAKTFNFPDYFGMNWDALNDCITDSTLFSNKGALIVFSDSGQFRLSANDDWQTAINIFLDAADFWKAKGKDFYLLLV